MNGYTKSAVLLTCILWSLIEGIASEEPMFKPLPRTNLLVYRDARGQFAPVRSKTQWRRRREEILAAMQSIMGKLPGRDKRCTLDMRVESELDCGSYVRRTITYASEPGSRVPACLLIPKTALRGKKCPAVLALHPTDMELGHRVIVEPVRDYYPPYASELAQQGMVVLAPAYPLMAQYQPDLKALGYESGTMKAIWDNVRGMDLLDSLPFVKKARYGAIGHSLGGHNAVYTAVFDERICVVVSSCGFDSYADYMNGKIQGWTSERYMPKLLAYRDHLQDIPFDFHELIAALAPRRAFISAPLGDSNFKWASVDAVVQSASKIYELYGVPQRLRVEHPECKHEFPRSMRDEAYGLLKQNLR